MTAPAAAPRARKPLPGRPKDPGKRAAILEAAKALFVREGYEGSSMDQIAALAGVSKLTVYSHFGDKQRLFTEVVQVFCEHGLPDGLFTQLPEQPLRERLIALGMAFDAVMMSPEAIAGYRMLVQPGLCASPVAEAFWQAGPQRIAQGFALLLQRRGQTGELRIDDPECAASQLIALLKGERHARALLGIERPAGEQAATHVAAAVDTFLRAYRPQ